MPYGKRFPEPWHAEFNPNLSLALMAYSVKDCPEMFWRSSYSNNSDPTYPSEYLVYCGGGETPIRSFDVYLNPGNGIKVVGPGGILPDIPLPKFYRNPLLSPEQKVQVGN
jgi:hypothetical protein